MKQTRPGSWRLWVSAGKDPDTGKYKYITRTVKGDKAAAERELHLMIANRETLAAKPQALRFGAWLGQVFQDMDTENSPTTMFNYRRLAERHILPAIGNRKLEDITVADLNGLYRRMRAQGLAPATIRQVHAVIRRSLRLALNEDRVKVNVAERATLPKVAKSQVSAPSPEDVGRILEAMKESRPDLVNFYLLAAITGARRGELCGLKWSDVDLDNRTLTIRRSLVYVPGSADADIATALGGDGPRGHGHKVMAKSTKTGNERTLKLDEIGFQVVLDQMRLLEEAVAQMAGARVDDPWLFISDVPDGAHPVHPDTVTKTFRKVARELGLSCTLHQLRHFTATQLIAKGMDVRTVAARLGHSSPAVTLNVYSHAIEAKGEEASATMSGVLGLGSR